MMIRTMLNPMLTLLVLPGLLFAQGPVAGRATPARPLSLADAVRASLQSSVGVTLADLEVRRSVARQRESRADLLPSVSAAASYLDRSMNLHTFGLEFPSSPTAEPLPDLIGPFSVGDARLVAHQTLLDPAALARTRSRSAEVRVTEASRSVAAERAAESTAGAYLRAVRAAAVLAARTTDVSLSERLVDLAQAQLEAGVGTGLDLTRARTQLATARGEELIARNELARSQMELARTLSLDPSTRFTLSDTLGTALGASDAPLGIDAAMQAARQRRPELAVERAELRQAGLERSAIRSERLPRIGLVGDWGYSGTTWDNTLATRQLGVEFSVPVFDGWRRDARVEEQEATIDASRARQRQIEIDLATEVESALLDIASAEDQERVARQRQMLAEQEVDEARDRFAQGVAGNIEVITAQSALVRARDAVIDARFGAATARVRLARATGMASTIR